MRRALVVGETQLVVQGPMTDEGGQVLITELNQADERPDGTGRSALASADGAPAVHHRLAATQVRRGETVTATMWVGAGAPSHWRVWQISADGIELRELGALARGPSVTPPDQPPPPETNVGIRLHVGSQTVTIDARVVSDDQAPAGHRMVRLRWVGRPWEKFEKLWTCPGVAVPWGVGRHPLIFERRVFFTVDAVGCDALHASFDASEELVFPGLVVPATITFPAVASAECQLEIQAVRAHPEDRNRMEAVLTFRGDSRELSDLIGQYALQSGRWVTPEALRASHWRRTRSPQQQVCSHLTLPPIC